MNLQKQYIPFDDLACDYDSLVPKIVPYYEEQNTIIIKLLPFERQKPIKVLDLGCGTGVLSHQILQTFPNASIVAFDLSPKMLSVCKSKLSAYSERIEYIQGDFDKDDLGDGYDLVVSGLAIHHLNDDKKRILFQKVYDRMKPEGTIFIRELVKCKANQFTQKYEELWREYMQFNHINDEEVFAKHLKEDIPSSVDEQLSWLEDVGFDNCCCHWRYLNFAFFSGQKPIS